MSNGDEICCGNPIVNNLSVEDGGLVRPTFTECALRIAPQAAFVRADSNADGRVDLADAVWTVSAVTGRGPPPPCVEAADANSDEHVDISDAMYTLMHLLLGAPPPAPPYPACGVDESSPAESCPAGSTLCEG